MDIFANSAQLPFAIVNGGQPIWYYACSWAYPQPWWIAEGCSHWNKRIDTEFLLYLDRGGKRGRLLIEGGRYKIKYMPAYYRVTSSVEWFCLGERARIQSLLACVTHVGKHTAMGWGRVAGWEIKPSIQDWSIRQDGFLMRGVPTDAGILYGIRPPYYMRSNQFPVELPIDGKADKDFFDNSL